MCFLFLSARASNSTRNPNFEIFEDGAAYACNFGIQGPNRTSTGLSYASGFVTDKNSGLGSKRVLAVGSTQSDQIFDSLGQPHAEVSQLVFSLSSEWMGSSYFIDFCLKPNSVRLRPRIPGQSQSNQGGEDLYPKPVLILSHDFIFNLSGVSQGTAPYLRSTSLLLTGLLRCQLMGSHQQNSNPSSIISLEKTIGPVFFTGELNFETSLLNQNSTAWVQSCVLRVTFTESANQKRPNHQQVEFISRIDLIPNF